MVYPIYKCSIDGKTQYLTKTEFEQARRYARFPKYCVMGEECGKRFTDEPEPAPQPEPAKTEHPAPDQRKAKPRTNRKPRDNAQKKEG